MPQIPESNRAGTLQVKLRAALAPRLPPSRSIFHQHILPVPCAHILYLSKFSAELGTILCTCTRICGSEGIVSAAPRLPPLWDDLFASSPQNYLGSRPRGSRTRRTLSLKHA